MTQEPESPKWRSHLNWICTFTIAFSGYLFVARPDPNGAQLAFRVGLLVLGLGGLSFLWLTRPRA